MRESLVRHRRRNDIHQRDAVDLVRLNDARNPLVADEHMLANIRNDIGDVTSCVASSPPVVGAIR